MKIEHATKVDNPTSSEDLVKEYAEVIELKQDLAILVDELTRQNSLSSLAQNSAEKIEKPIPSILTAPTDSTSSASSVDNTISLFIDIFVSETRAIQQHKNINNKFSNLFNGVNTSIERHPENINFYSIKVPNIANYATAELMCLYVINNNHTCKISKNKNSKALL